MEKEVRQRYNKISLEYCESLRWDKYRDLLIEKFARRISGKILDVGCGPGFTTKILRQNGLDVVGVDVSERMVGYAREQFPNLRFYEGGMKSLDFYPESFEGIFCYQVFQHIPPSEQEGVLREFARVLKPQGLMMFNTKNLFYPRNFVGSLRNYLLNQAENFGEVEIGGQTQSYRYFSRERTLSQKIRNSGFNIEEFHGRKFSNWLQFWLRKKQP